MPFGTACSVSVKWQLTPSPLGLKRQLIVQVAVKELEHGRLNDFDASASRLLVRCLRVLEPTLLLPVSLLLLPLVVGWWFALAQLWVVVWCSLLSANGLTLPLPLLFLVTAA